MIPSAKATNVTKIAYGETGDVALTFTTQAGPRELIIPREHLGMWIAFLALPGSGHPDTRKRDEALGIMRSFTFPALTSAVSTDGPNGGIALGFTFGEHHSRLSFELLPEDATALCEMIQRALDAPKKPAN